MLCHVVRLLYAHRGLQVNKIRKAAAAQAPQSQGRACAVALG